MDQDGTYNLTLLVEGSFDKEELFDVTNSLKTELKELDIEFAEAQRNGKRLPSGAKAGDPLTVGAIWLGITVATIPNLILLVQNWILRHKDQTISVKIKEVELEVPRDTNEEEIKRIVRLIKSISQDA